MPSETQPEEPQEVKPARSKYNVLGVAYDYYKEAWDNLWREERTDLKREVEAQRGIIEKDGLKFKEMKFDEAGKVKPEQQLQSYVTKIPPLTAEERQFRVMMASKKGETAVIPDVVRETSKIKTVEDMVAELPDAKYSKGEKELIRKYVEATQYVESRGSYGILGDEIVQTEEQKKHNYIPRHMGDRALGKYQPMPKNWKDWNIKLFDNKIVEPDRQAQEYVAFKQFMKNYDELKAKKISSELVGLGRNREIALQMASRWYGGGQIVEILGLEIPTGKEMDTIDYIQSILTQMGMGLSTTEYSTLAVAAGYSKAKKEGGKMVEAVKKESGKAYDKAKLWWKSWDKTADRK